MAQVVSFDCYVETTLRRCGLGEVGTWSICSCVDHRDGSHHPFQRARRLPTHIIRLPGARQVSSHVSVAGPTIECAVPASSSPAVVPLRGFMRQCLSSPRPPLLLSSYVGNAFCVPDTLYQGQNPLPTTCRLFCAAVEIGSNNTLASIDILPLDVRSRDQLSRVHGAAAQTLASSRLLTATASSYAPAVQRDPTATSSCTAPSREDIAGLHMRPEGLFFQRFPQFDKPLAVWEPRYGDR